MIVVIAGSRGLESKHTYAALDFTSLEIDRLISGDANGPDKDGARWGRWQGIPVDAMPADWRRYGKPAGHIRNEAQGARMDAAVVVWDGESRGAWDMACIALRLQKPLELYGPIPTDREIECDPVFVAEDVAWDDGRTDAALAG